MPKANRTHSTPDLSPAIARLRELAAEAGDHLLLADGPVSPDAELLDLCADALHLLVHAEKARQARCITGISSAPYTDEMRAHHEELWKQSQDLDANAKPKMYRIRKMTATTAAGVFAKAMVVRASVTGAAILAMSLAEDLISCPGLREALWPAGEPAETAAGD